MKHFGLHKGILFYTTGGTFAADSWIANNGECVDANISGNSFEAVLADDGKVYNIGTKDLTPISETEFNKLIETAHSAFKLRVELDKTPGIKTIRYLMDRNFIADVMEQGCSVEEIKEHFLNPENNYFRKLK